MRTEVRRRSWEKMVVLPALSRTDSRSNSHPLFLDAPPRRQPHFICGVHHGPTKLHFSSGDLHLTFGTGRSSKSRLLMVSARCGELVNRLRSRDLPASV
jgi:hypothetical protein